MSFKVKNVNIGFEMIAEAVNEFSGFILGQSELDVISQLLGSVIDNPTKDGSDSELKQRKKLLAEILDRTSAGLSLHSINEKEYFKEVNYKDLININKIVSVIHKNQRLGISSEEIAFGDNLTNEMLENEMASMLKYPNPDQFSYTIGDESVSFTGTSDDLEEALESLNSNIDPESLDKYNNPSLGAIVVKDASYGFNARQSNHTPVFLNAINPLEMSRCSPFFDIKIVTKNISNKNKLGIYNFLRIEENENENNFTNPVPESVSTEEGSNYFNFMDLFTSPQTMVNPRVNHNFQNESFENLFENFFSSKRESFEYSSVKDPMQPFMTLESFNVSITGKGYGLLSSKKATLKIKLHDKSRIKDLAPLLSPNQFAFTKFIVEFGWSHPDGLVNSNNTLGKYLNSLRDTGVYQLVNASYDFGNNNSVNITLNLMCSGFQQMKTVSSAGGIETNIVVLQDNIQDFLNKKFRNEDIRSKARVVYNGINKRSTMVPFEKLSELEELIKNDDISTSELYELIFSNDNSAAQIEVLSNDNSNEEEIREAISILQTEEGKSAGQIILAKLASLKTNKHADHFKSQVSSNYVDYVLDKIKNEGSSINIDQVELIGTNGTYENSDCVSLGKVISMFIGYPMATCGIYDEVQLLFYPVNTQSAAARKHTTASFPISISDLKDGIEKRILASEEGFQNLSVHGFFSMLDRIVSNTKNVAYGIYSEENNRSENSITSLEDDLEEFKNKSRQEKLVIIKSDNSFNYSDEETSEASEASENQKISAYMSYLANKINEERSQRIERVFDAERDNIKCLYDKTRFSPVSLSMYFETLPIAEPSGLQGQFGIFENYLEKFKGSATGRREVTSNGVFYDKTILRIHIYDEYSNMNPDLTLYDLENPRPQGVSIDENINSVIEDIEDKPFSYFKNLLMNFHPTIIHGASSGVVNNISINANTSGVLSNILMVEAYGRSINAGDLTDQQAQDGDEVVLIPATINLELMGFPTLSRGQQIFIDFGTQTSLDNVYTVKTVDHSISQGSFKTNALLVPVNQMIVSSYKNTLINKIEKLRNIEGSE